MSEPIPFTEQIVFKDEDGILRHSADNTHQLYAWPGPSTGLWVTRDMDNYWLVNAQHRDKKTRYQGPVVPVHTSRVTCAETVRLLAPTLLGVCYTNPHTERNLESWQWEVERLRQAIKDAVRVLNYDGQRPLNRLMEARADLLQAVAAIDRAVRVDAVVDDPKRAGFINVTQDELAGLKELLARTPPAPNTDVLLLEGPRLYNVCRHLDLDYTKMQRRDWLLQIVPVVLERVTP
jgi:hypothetical protein